MKAFFLHKVRVCTTGTLAAVLFALCLTAGFPTSLCAQQGTGESPLRVNVSKKKAGANENITVEFVITKDYNNFQAPQFTNLSVLAGPSTMTSTQSTWINGKSSIERKTTVSYLVQPREQGTASIGAASITVRGYKYQSQPVQITVTEPLEMPADPSNPAAQARSSIHLMAEVSNRNPYLGEAVTVTYKLYYKMSLGNISFLETPKFDGFWTQSYDMSASQETDGYYKDELYRVATLYKVLLIPQKTGSIPITPMSIGATVSVGTGRYDWFGEEITRSYNHSVSTGTQSVNVRELPSQGRPADFSGAVGNFQMDVSLSRPEVSANESVNLIVKVSGKGNLNLFKLPVVTIGDDIEKYDPKNHNDVKLTPTGLEGSVTEEILLIPRYKGVYQIAPPVFTYFDPKTSQYHTLSKEGLTITVAGGSAQPASPAGVQPTEKTVVNYLNKDIGFIQLTTELSPLREPDPMLWATLSWLFFLPFFILTALFALKKLLRNTQSDTPETRSRKAGKVARKRLRGARKALESGAYALFYTELETSVYGFLMHRLRLERSGLSRESIERRLSLRGVDADTLRQLFELLDKCEMARYAGIPPAQAPSDYTLALHVIETIDKKL